MTLSSPAFSLDDIYTRDEGRAFMTGIQALVRLPMLQRRRDRGLGLSTAGLISGYRGSPLGAYDQQLWRAQKHLADHDVVFQPGLNEDLAATALWGAQMHRAFGATRVDGVFGVWYGKGPGVDRSGDAFRSANIIGTAALGGVLAVAGDDHAAQSSMFPHQTDLIFQSVSMPVLQPADVADILRLGAAGISLSRFSGLWVAMKTVAEVVESAGVVDLAPMGEPRTPTAVLPPHGLNWDPGLAWPGQRAELERRLLEERLPAARAWASANRIDRPVIDARAKQLCIVTTGKAHQDVLQALEDLGLDPADASDLGVCLYQVAMTWPLGLDDLMAFAAGAGEILVVEEKQPIVEDQLKAGLFNYPAARRPRVTGKTDGAGAPLLPATLELNPLLVAQALVARLTALNSPAQERLRQRLAELEAGCSAELPVFPLRKPFFCSGCPHNRSTRTPEGSVSGGGIGCHIMALSQPALRTPTFSHMGGEGLQWVGAAPFSATEHVFQNLGDGTYQHSGVLAIRAAVAAGANITFKILFNDAVAMTGGQPAEGAPDPVRILRQLEAEGVRAMALVSETPERWRDATGLPARARLLDRDALDEVQRDFRQTPGVTAIVYDQTCAAEKRRRRKRGLLETPSKRLYINPRVCEGCGDCSRASSCISIEPIETEFGAKRRINQSQCNLDFSCVQGFCPSFVELEAPVLKRPDPRRLEAIEAQAMGALPDPPERRLDRPYNIYIGGIGGLGVLTLGAILGAAAHIDGKIATVLDFTGLAQKNGAVVSQVRIAPVGRPIHAARIGASQADLLLGVDAVVGSATDAMRKIARGRTAAILNSDVAPTSDAVSDRDAALPKDQMIEAVLEVCDPHASEVLSATQITLGLFGDAIATNTFLLGLAFQRGLIPLSEAAILAAIEANGAAVALNLRAFRWGRLAVVNRERVEGIASVPAAAAEPTLAEFIARRVEDLTAYQDAAYARRYRALVDRALAAAGGGAMDGGRFARAVARGAYKLMAYKDEYEVARLYSESTFRDGLDAQFSGYRKLSVWLAPPLLSSKDPATGRPRKRRFGPWIFPLLRGLAALKGLRGSWADPFGHTRERRLERQLAEAYGRMIERLCADLGPETLDAAVALADLPQEIRGFGLVKEAAAEAALARFSEAGLPKPPPAYRIHRPTPESSRVAA